MARALHYCQQAAGLAPRLYIAQEKLGELLTKAGQWPQAVQAFRRASALQPEDAAAANNLAWLLATCPDPQVRSGPKAVERAERARRIAGDKEPVPLQSLAAAYAEAGRFDDAVRVASRALEIAGLREQPGLTAAIDSQLTLYRQGRPYHLPEGK
jgi:Flp pilus assembly protein TadD